MRRGTVSCGAVFAVLGVLIAAALPDHALAENVLILSQGSFFTTAIQDNDSLKNVLQAYGNNVTIGGPYASFDGTELEGQDVVVLPQFDVPDMPIKGQQALLDFVSRGGGLIANAFTYWKRTAKENDYFVMRGGLERLGQLLPVQRISFPFIIDTETLTLTEAIWDPVLMSGIPPSFSFWVGTDIYEQGSQALLVPQSGATVFYASAGSYRSPETLGLVGWRYGNGHVLQFSTRFEHELADATFDHLLANAVRWAGGAVGPSVPYGVPKCSRDFDGDGKSDILWQDSAGNVFVGLMNGAAITNESFISNVWLGWSIVGCGDFNGDGKADILWRDTTGNVAIWLMNG